MRKNVLENERVHHIMGFSGGKDSAALAVYLRDRLPDVEYFFVIRALNFLRPMSFLPNLKHILVGVSIVLVPDEILTIGSTYIEEPYLHPKCAGAPVR